MEFRDFLEGKRWEAKQEDILRLWNSIRPYLPITPQPIPLVHTGTRYDDDGIRITGSPSFINSVLSRLKDCIKYDKMPGIELDVQYKQIENRGGSSYAGNRYVCYIHVLQAEPKKIEPPKKIELDK